MTENSTLVTQRTKNPTRKQSYNLLGSQIATVSLGVIAVFFPEEYARIPAGFEASFGALLGGLMGFAFGWFVKERV
jgi:hypothetical protein